MHTEVGTPEKPRSLLDAIHKLQMPPGKKKEERQREMAESDLKLLLTDLPW